MAQPFLIWISLVRYLRCWIGQVVKDEATDVEAKSDVPRVTIFVVNRFLSDSCERQADRTNSTSFYVATSIEVVPKSEQQVPTRETDFHSRFFAINFQSSNYQRLTTRNFRLA